MHILKGFHFKCHGFNCDLWNAVQMVKSKLNPLLYRTNYGEYAMERVVLCVDSVIGVDNAVYAWNCFTINHSMAKWRRRRTDYTH